MFSRLEPLFLKTFRQAESTDTRQAIRDEHKEERRREDENERDTNNEQDLWTDSTSVSVESLKTFLVAFLKEQIEADQNSSRTSTPADNIDFKARPSTPLGGQAAQAYQNTARYNEDHNVSANTPADESAAKSVDSEDVRKINHLIRDLNTIAKTGVTELNIPRAGTFLESLERAIQLALKS